jgi:hypothetical protein
MSFKFGLTALAGAVALALGGTAMANTTLDGVTKGDLFLNIVDTSNNTSFLYDTGISQASFTGSSFSVALASDPNYQAFIAGKGASDILDYSVISGTRTTTTPAVGTVDFTANTLPSAVEGNGISSAQTIVSLFTTQANAASSTTTNSVLLGSTNNWGLGSNEGVVGNQLGITALGDNGAIGTALAFYSETTNALRSTTVPAVLTTFAGTWDLTSAGVLSFAGTSTPPPPPVPLPTPVLLLLSGLGLMGVVARRGKSVGGAFASGAAAI